MLLLYGIQIQFRAYLTRSLYFVVTVSFTVNFTLCSCQKLTKWKPQVGEVGVGDLMEVEKRKEVTKIVTNKSGLQIMLLFIDKSKILQQTKYSFG